ncbi:hypothetical protein [Streptomyces sp. ISL-94]|uniref:hypothetical protein n=1 Tax=Streptomyces sp. ISL-94 TaxID=2819190 RepID=UPI001BECC4B3|nr:hypothetical protein [Streptomyces sp. ISL-94]MBT2477659.1 hypothetical protein [Streptomyces sp. ISL-94]
MSTPPPPARPKIPRPAGALLTKSKGGGRGGNDATVFVAFANGMIRRLTDAEFACWDDVTIDYLIPVGAEFDYQYTALVAYDNALRA